MKIIDLTHPIGIGTKGWPGCGHIVGWPLFDYARTNYQVLYISTDMHTGTHMDATRHCLPDGIPTDQMPLEKCMGQTLVVDMRHKGFEGAHFEIEDFQPFEQQIRQYKKVILMTGWSRHWETPLFYSDKAPGFSRPCAQWLVDRGLELIGVEQASIHPTDHLAIHTIFFKAEAVIVEGLDNVEALSPGVVEFFAVPLRLKEGDGSLVRAYARV